MKRNCSKKSTKRYVWALAGLLLAALLCRFAFNQFIYIDKKASPAENMSDSFRVALSLSPFSLPQFEEGYSFVVGGKTHGLAGIRYWAPDYEGWYTMSMFEFSNKVGTAKTVLKGHKDIAQAGAQ